MWPFHRCAIHIHKASSGTRRCLQDDNHDMVGFSATIMFIFQVMYARHSCNISCPRLCYHITVWLSWGNYVPPFFKKIWSHCFSLPPYLLSLSCLSVKLFYFVPALMLLYLLMVSILGRKLGFNEKSDQLTFVQKALLHAGWQVPSSELSFIIKWGLELSVCQTCVYGNVVQFERLIKNYSTWNQKLWIYVSVVSSEIFVENSSHIK